MLGVGGRCQKGAVRRWCPSVPKVSPPPTMPKVGTRTRAVPTMPGRLDRRLAGFARDLLGGPRHLLHFCFLSAISLPLGKGTADMKELSLT